MNARLKKAQESLSFPAVPIYWKAAVSSEQTAEV